MLALPIKKYPEKEEDEKIEVGKVVAKWVEEEFGESEASRYRVRLRTVDEARSAALEAISELLNEQGIAAEVLGQRTQVNELSSEGEAKERLLRPLRRYASELLSIDRRTECDLSGIGWYDAWPKENALSSSGFASGGKRLLLAALKSKKSIDPITSEHSTIIQGDLRLERWSILYNLACAETIAGAGLERDSEQGVRAACRHFQRAAGIFSYLRKSAQFGQKSSDQAQRDATPAALLIAENTALAQAQACFYEKAIAAGQVNAGIVAKLATQAAAYYWRARAALSAPTGLPGTTTDFASTEKASSTTTAGIADTRFLPPGASTTDATTINSDPVLVSSSSSSRLAALQNGNEDIHFPSLESQRHVIIKQWPRPPEYVEKTSTKLTQTDEAWAIHLEFQARCFEAASALWSSRKVGEDATNSGNGYGLQLSWLRRCGRWCASALIVSELSGSHVTAEAARGASGLREHAAAQFSSLLRDNDTIYRERIPEDNELPLVHGVALAKPSKPESWLVGSSGSSPARVALCAQQTVSVASKFFRSSALRGLLPRSARSAAAAHAENAQRAARLALAQAADGDDLERAALASLELPQALNDLDDCASFAHHGVLPDSLARRASEAMPDQTLAEDSLRGAYSRLEVARTKALAAIEEAGEHFVTSIDESNDDDNDDSSTQASSRLSVSRMLGEGLPSTPTSSTRDSKSGQQLELEELRELKEQSALGAKTDAALLARLDDAEVQASLAALDEAIERHRGAESPQKHQSVGEEVSLAVAKCRTALTQLRSNGEEWMKAARELETTARLEAQASIEALDSLADAGLPLLVHDEPYESEVLASSSQEDQEESSPDDEEPPWLVPTSATKNTVRRSVSIGLDASAAVRLVLETRYKRVVEAPVLLAQACAEKQHDLVEALATARNECAAAARRDPAARAARDALTRVADGARNMEQLALSLAEGASFYLELQRRAQSLASGDFARMVSATQSQQQPNSNAPFTSTTHSILPQMPISINMPYPPEPPPAAIQSPSPRYLQQLESKPVQAPMLFATAGFSEPPPLNHQQISSRRKQEEEDEALARRLAAEDGIAAQTPSYQQNNPAPQYQDQYRLDTMAPPYQQVPAPRYQPQQVDSSLPIYQRERSSTSSITPSSIVSRYEQQQQQQQQQRQPRVYEEQVASAPATIHKPLAGEDLVAKILGNSAYNSIPPPYNEPARPSAQDQEAADLELARRLDREEREQAAKNKDTPSYESLAPPPAYEVPDTTPPAYPMPSLPSRPKTKPVTSYARPSPPSTHDGPPSAFDLGSSVSKYDAPPSAFGSSYATPLDAPPNAFGGSYSAPPSLPPPAFSSLSNSQQSRGYQGPSNATNSDDGPPPAFF